VDRKDVSNFEPDDIGDVVWDSDFEMWSTAQQEYLYTTCQELKNSSLVYQPPNSEFVKCPIEEWKDYLETMNMTFPYDASSESAFAEMWNSFLNSDNAENTMAYQLSYVDNDGGDYTVKFYAMYIQLPVSDSAPSTVVKEYRDDFDDYIAENKDDCPGTLCDYMHNSCYRWWLLALEENFVISAFTGIAMALPLAFIVLLISTRNWIISIFAMLDIIGVISCELCAFYVFQWKFGVVESIAVIMIIGFSVDYVVHLANSYLESNGESRMERLSFALLTMGVSVVSGAITTMLSGLMLVFPAYVFFYKMGWIIVTTVLLALMWALIFFPSIVALAGPEGDSGDLNKYLVFCPCQSCKEQENSGSQDEPREEGNEVELQTQA